MTTAFVPRVRAALPWLALLVALTAVLILLRSQLDKAHLALAYLILVLFGSSRGGRAIGLGLAVLAFLCFNFFLLPPHYTFDVHDQRDWLVLISFLLTAVVGAELLDRARRETRAARQRADEIDRLSTLGAETLNAGRAEEAVGAIAEVIRTTLDLGCCQVWGPAGELFHCIATARRTGYSGEANAALDSLVPVALERGGVVTQRPDGTSVVEPSPQPTPAELFARADDTTAFLLPLHVRGRAVGVLRLEDDRPIRLDLPGRRFTEVLSYYAALGVERVRLLADAERVEGLREADRLKDALMAAVSHDLRTPLTTIKGLGHELMLDGDERAAIIVEEADRLNRVVTDLLELSRLNSGGVPLHVELNPADDLISAAVQQTAGILGDHELRVSMPHDDVLIGCFDLVHSVRALANLIHNAAKYSPPCAPIDLTLNRRRNVLLVAVEDRGPGVPEADREHIFEPFHRRSSGGTDGGAGLGLSIARRLAEAQGGGVYYEPRADGGSRFVLELPAGEVPELID